MTSLHKASAEQEFKQALARVDALLNDESDMGSAPNEGCMALGRIEQTTVATAPPPPGQSFGDPRVWPTINALCSAGQQLFGKLGGQAIGAIGTSELEQELNGIGAQVAYQVVRQHFKRSLKSSNKSYEVREDSDPKAHAGALRQKLAAPEFDALVQRQATLEERASRGIGNCSEMATLATLIARGLGLHADVWAYQSSMNTFSHEFCIVGQVSSSPSFSLPIQQWDVHGDSDARELWVVDPWAGVCCPANEFDATFESKMSQWAQAGKLILSGDSWLRPDDPAWRQATTRSEHEKAKLLSNVVLPEYSPLQSLGGGDYGK